MDFDDVKTLVIWIAIIVGIFLGGGFVMTTFFGKSWTEILVGLGLLIVAIIVVLVAKTVVDRRR